VTAGSSLRTSVNHGKTAERRCPLNTSSLKLRESQRIKKSFLPWIPRPLGHLITGLLPGDIRSGLWTLVQLTNLAFHVNFFPVLIDYGISCRHIAAEMPEEVFLMKKEITVRSITCMFYLAFFLIWLIAGSLPAFSDQEGPGQMWVSGGVEAPLSKKLRASLSTELRYNNAGLYYQDWELALVSRISPKVDYEIMGFKHVEKLSGRTWQGENDFFGSVTLKGRLGSLALSDRNRLEVCTFTYGSPGYVRYRNKLTLALEGKFVPYVADEVFFDIGTSTPGLNRNRIFAGFKGSVGRDTDLDLYFMRQTDAKFLDEGETKERFSAVGGTLTIRF